MQLAFQAEGRGFEPRLPLYWKSDSYRKKLPDFFVLYKSGLTVSLTVWVKPRVKPEITMSATITSNSNFGEIVAIYIKKSAKHEATNHSYGWFNEFFSEAFENLKA